MQISLQIILTVAGYFVFSSAVGAMSPPSDAQKAGFYGWFYRFLQRLAANADRIAESRLGALMGGGSGDETVVAATRESSTVAVVTSGGK